MRKGVMKILILLTIVNLFCANIAYAQETYVTQEAFTSEQDTPIAQKTIEIEGAVWELTEQSTLKDLDYKAEVKTYTQDVDLVLTPTQNINLQSQFEQSLHISDGLFVGDITLVDVSSEPVYITQTGQIDKSYTISGGLSTNDVEALYSQGYSAMSFETRSSDFYGAYTTVTLPLAYPEFFIVSWDAFGIPSEYGAVLHYRGSESWLEVSHYNARASYSGEIISSEEGFILESTYTPAPVSTPTPEQNYNHILFGVAATGVAGAAGFLLFWLTRKVRLCELQEKEIIIIEKIRPILSGNRYIIKVTKSVNLNSAFIDVPSKYAKKTGEVEIIVNDKTVYVGTWSKRIELQA